MRSDGQQGSSSTRYTVSGLRGHWPVRSRTRDGWARRTPRARTWRLRDRRRDRRARPPLSPPAHQVTLLLTANRFGPMLTDGARFACCEPKNRMAPPAPATARPAAPRPVFDSFDTEPDTNSPPLVWRNP